MEAQQYLLCKTNVCHENLLRDNFSAQREDWDLSVIGVRAHAHDIFIIFLQPSWPTVNNVYLNEGKTNDF